MLKERFIIQGGGSLSAAQVIFLDASQAKAITLGYQETLAAESAALISCLTKAIAQAEVLWKTAQGDAQFWGRTFN